MTDETRDFIRMYLPWAAALIVIYFVFPVLVYCMLEWWRYWLQ